MESALSNRNWEYDYRLLKYVTYIQLFMSTFSYESICNAYNLYI